MHLSAQTVMFSAAAAGPFSQRPMFLNIGSLRVYFVNPTAGQVGTRRAAPGGLHASGTSLCTSAMSA